MVDETMSKEKLAEEKSIQDSEVQIIKTREGLEVRINEDGSVTFINLPADMLDLAFELDPDATIACDTAPLVADEAAADESPEN